MSRFSLSSRLTGPAARRSVTAAVSVTAVLLSACASEPPAPTAAIGAATQAIAAADRTGAGANPSPELTEARSKLGAANTALAADYMILADRLARESRVDAELASARAEAASAQVVNDEIRNGTAALSTEMRRSSGETP